MRIIAGSYGGRQLTAPKAGATRPMTDMVRAALFDIVGPVEGWRVLDAYAGSGALGFEALSRGATRAVGVEAAKPAIEAIRLNKQRLGLKDNYSLFSITVENWLVKLGTASERFDLIIADPPYAELQPPVLSRLAALLAEGGVLVVSHRAKDITPDLPGCQLANERTYGDTRLSFYRHR